MYKTLTSLILAAAANCPLVGVEGTYLIQLITENSPKGCPVKGGGYVIVNADGLMVQSEAFKYFGGSPGKFGGRIEPGTEPMQWTGTSSHEYYAIEYQGTWKRGQLSGQFMAKGAKGSQLGLECKGKVVGFKKGK